MMKKDSAPANISGFTHRNIRMGIKYLLPLIFFTLFPPKAANFYH